MSSVVHVELPDRRKSSPEERRIFIEQNPEIAAANGGERMCEDCPSRGSRIYIIGWKKIVWFGAPSLILILLGIIGWFENGWRVSVDADRSRLASVQQDLDHRVLVLEQMLPVMQSELKRVNTQLEVISERQEMFYRWLYDDRQKLEWGKKAPPTAPREKK